VNNLRHVRPNPSSSVFPYFSTSIVLAPETSPLLPQFNISLTKQNLLSLALDQLLDVGNALGQDLLQDLGVLELFGDLCDDAVGEFFLLSLLDLAFVADPRVKHSLRLGGQERLLL
jgi:hypothetical protein